MIPVYGALERILAALKALGQNKLTIAQNDYIYELDHRILDLQRKREELRVRFVHQHDPTGEGWASVADAPADLVAQVAELMTTEVDLAIGAPIPGSLDTVTLDTQSYAVLRDLGVIQ